MSVVLTVLTWVFAVCLGYVLLLGCADLLRLALALLYLARYAGRTSPMEHSRAKGDETTAPVTVVLPGCGDARNAVEYVEHHLKLDYPQYEVVAVCGRHTALEKLRQAFGLVRIDQPIRRSVPMGAVRGIYRSPRHPELIVVDKVSIGRGDDLNCGVNVGRYPLVATAAPGRWLKRTGLRPLAEPIIARHSVLAVGGLPRLAGGMRGMTERLQQAWLLKEYPAGVSVPGQKRLPLVPQGYGAFRKSALVSAGGFAPSAWELDTAVRLFTGQKGQAAGVQMLPCSAWQILPWERFSGLWENCRSVQKELQSALWSCRAMVFRPRYGRAGMWDVPLHMLRDVAGPVLETLGIVLSAVLYGVGAISSPLFLGFWTAQVLFGMLVGLAAVLCQQVEERDTFTMTRLWKGIGCAVLYPLGFRQLIAVLRAAAVLASKK